MTKDEALLIALEALDDLARYADTCEMFLKETHPGKAGSLRQRVTKSIEAVTAIKAVQEAKDDPVAWMYSPTGALFDICPNDADEGEFLPLYTTPPQRKPLVFGLNDDGQFTFSVGVQTFTLDYFPENDEETEFMKRQLTHAIEAAHGIT